MNNMDNYHFLLTLNLVSYYVLISVIVFISYKTGRPVFLWGIVLLSLCFPTVKSIDKHTCPNCGHVFTHEEMKNKQGLSK